MLGVVVFAAFLYYQPLASYLDRREELARRSEEVAAAASAQKETLERRLEASKSPAELAREARRLGLVKEGEHLFIVKGVEAWKRAREATIDRGDR